MKTKTRQWVLLGGISQDFFFMHRAYTATDEYVDTSWTRMWITGSHTLRKIMGKFQEFFGCLQKKSHFFFIKMCELFAHFEKKMGKFWETYKIFPKFSRDFYQCRTCFILSTGWPTNKEHDYCKLQYFAPFFGGYLVQLKHHRVVYKTKTIQQLITTICQTITVPRTKIPPPY